MFIHCSSKALKSIPCASQNSLIFFIADILGLLFPPSQRLIEEKETPNSRPNASCDKKHF
nr:MAG TPA: hypothetical protein [Caudoviricetes sp.]